MSNRILVVMISAILAALGSSGPALAAVSGQTALESQEAEIGPMLRQGYGVDEQTVRDMRAQGAIYNALLQGTDIDPDRLNIDVSDGHVRLTGDVTSDQDRDTVVRLAENTEYVTSVEDEIKIASAAS